MKELQDQIEKINKTYEEVIEVNQLFNDSTNQYNQEKMEFYKQSKLDVEFEK
jgi:membrane protein insertase Oxa1/YidC/SpoIIIJ